MTSYTIEAGDSDNPLDVSLSYNDGDEIDYPFDKYTGSFQVAATYVNDTAHAIPITFQLSASLTSFAFQPTLIPSELNQDRVGLHIITGRSTTTIGFSLFVCVLMWAMSLVMLVFGYQVVRRRRRINAHASMIGLTMLFALPALRSAQPGAPAIGCTSDILSFYWNMAIIACVSIAILSCWVIRWNKEDDAEHHSQHFGSVDIEKPCVEHIERLPPHNNPNHSEITVV
ncbi:hypothetical protein LRAMOSA04465 [Lichtheimia ramosa]|uniref:Uncharacterized protein n=1 Tax=Lichtheimia ramosa TaxID=688394 RepID=A0A077WYB9_9FUNG|nr:hypothetical protein LRAMOSA04465 [Lichtheimia ramosa]